jgi:phosphatidylglycerophosphate synthase
VSIVDGRDFVISRYLTIKDKREHFESHVMNGDEEALLRKAAVKDWDNLWTSIAVSPWTQYVAFWFSKTSITPNQVTIGSFALTLFAATAFALNNFWLNVAGAILVQLSFGADCIDGQLARMTGKFSRLGAWLDWMSDRVKELLLVVGLGIGSVTEGNSWDMSFAVLMIFVLRSAVNESFEMHRSHSVPNDSVQSQPLGFIGLERKVKNFITLPYGNRMGLISICIIVFDADMTLRILFLWSAFAATYQLLGRTLRGGGAKTVNTGILRDDGPITKWLLDRLPKVYGELSVFAFISIFLLLWLLTNKWILALLAVIGLCIASFPLVSRSIWLGPVFTCVAEFAVFWSALLVTDEKYHWIFISVLLLSGISRVIISTGLRFQRLSAHHSKRFSWEERSALMLVTFLIWPPLSSLVGLLLLIKMKKSLRHQIRALHLPQ